MADQCIVCLENLDVEPAAAVAAAAPPIALQLPLHLSSQLPSKLSTQPPTTTTITTTITTTTTTVLTPSSTTSVPSAAPAPASAAAPAPATTATTTAAASTFSSTPDPNTSHPAAISTTTDNSEVPNPAPTTPPAQLKGKNSSPRIDADTHISHTEDHKIALIDACGHILHDACLREWTGKANSCPICRQTFHLVHVYDKIGGKLMHPPFTA